MECSRTLGIVAGILLAAGPAAAQEIGPVDVETLNPITAQNRVDRETGAAALERMREIPLLTPFSEAEFAARKEGAARDPRLASPADQVIGASGPSTQGAAQVTASFFGTNILQAQNSGFLSVPPDPQVAASGTRVIEAVNSSIRARTRNGTLVQTLDLNQFFGLPPADLFDQTLFDPKVIYDPNAQHKRFYVVALQTSFPPDLPRSSFIWLAVSRSPNPANLNPANWCFYRLNGRRNGGTDLDSWADFPGLGAGAEALVITTNQFTFDTFFFTFAIVRALNKLVLSDNAASCPRGLRLTSFQASEHPGDGAAFTLQPVQQLTSPSSFRGTRNPMYLTNTIFANAPPKDYRVYRLRNVATSPSLSFTTVTGNFAYFVPPNVPQENDFGFITTNDERMMEAAGVGNAFWAAHPTACSFFRGGNVSCNRVIRVAVGQSPGGALQAGITQQRTFGRPNEFLFMPGIAVNLDETVAVPFHFASRSRTNNYALSTWWAVKAFGEGSFAPLGPLTTGGCQQLVVRTGDYSGAETDPTDLKSFWLSGERARRIRELEGNPCLWETRIIRVTPGG